MVNNKQLQYYKKMLRLLGSLSGLFSESNTPYLNYRIAENLFCKSFDAKNLSRSDVSVDAAIGCTGVGIKTFLKGSGKTLQKIAEFNKQNITFRDLSSKEVIKKIPVLRNKRLATTTSIYGLNKLKYHCLTRDASKIEVFECGMDLIDLQKINKLKASKNTISFNDSFNEYSFNISKSTLYKRFYAKKILFKVGVKIIEDPFEILEDKFLKYKEKHLYEFKKEKPSVILPLYSITKQKKVVFPKSGLNQWNAEGRKRDPDEIYIPIPRWVHKVFPKFFLGRDRPFNLILPDGTILQAKICQEGSKALMTKHNADLGKWLLRKVLKLKERELLTYSKLLEIGLDSVIIEKIDSHTYSIDFRPTGTYEDFLGKFKRAS